MAKASVPPGGRTVYEFRSDYPVAQCVSVEVVIERGTGVTVASITVAGVEQLLGEGVPAEFLASTPLQLDRQTAADTLCVTLQNDGAHEVSAEVLVGFVPVESVRLFKSRMH